ncbi:MAG: transcription antitermination factor NusB [Clostridia bacterium]|nr:transcription antitermination factor NusB [Clostridia bacterium]
MRRIAREIAFMLIYEEQFNKDRVVDFSFDFLKNESEIVGDVEFEKEDEVFSKEIIVAYEENKENIIELVNKHLFGYEPNRVYKVDNALLYLAVTELYYVKTPVAVVINEAVELAKKYSTDKSAKFINGILGAIIKDISPESK